MGWEPTECATRAEEARAAQGAAECGLARGAFDRAGPEREEAEPLAAVMGIGNERRRFLADGGPP